MFRLILAVLMFASPMAIAQVSNVQVTAPWARAAPQGRVGAVYLDLMGGPDRLVSVASDIAGKVELHETILEDGVARMRPSAGVLISPGARTRLTPGGLHVMLFDLKRPLKEGESFQLTLTFERARAVALTVPVLRAGATAGPGEAAYQGHNTPASRR